MVGKGEKSQLCDPGSELRLGGKEKRKGQQKKEGMERKEKEKGNTPPRLFSPKLQHDNDSVGNTLSSTFDGRITLSPRCRQNEQRVMSNEQ